MPHAGEEGTVGFFEDIPVLMVVTIATGIFLFSLVHAYAVHLDSLESQRLQGDAMELQRAVRGYERLISKSEEGVFEGEKLISLTADSLMEDFDPGILGFEYQISIIDTSDYPSSQNYTKTFETSEPPARGNRYSSTTSVLIKAEGTYHAAQLIITIWS